ELPRLARWPQARVRHDAGPSRYARGHVPHARRQRARSLTMLVTCKGYTFDSLAINSADHLLTAIAQLELLDQTALAFLHEWCEEMIQIHNRDDIANQRAVLVAFDKLVCSLIDERD